MPFVSPHHREGFTCALSTLVRSSVSHWSSFLPDRRVRNRSPSLFDDFRDFPAQVSDFPGRFNTHVDGSRRVRQVSGVSCHSCVSLTSTGGLLPTVQEVSLFERSPVMAGGTDEGTCYQVSHRTIWLYPLVVVASKLTIFLKEINVKLTLVLWSGPAGL